MNEGIPKSGKEIDELKTEIDELTEQEKHPVFKINDRRSVAEAPQPSAESEILSREAKIRELESLDQEAEIRKRIAELTKGFAHPIPGALKKASPEQEILDLENELHGLERKRKGLPAEDGKTSVLEQPKEEAKPNSPTENLPALREEGVVVQRQENAESGIIDAEYVDVEKESEEMPEKDAPWWKNKLRELVDKFPEEVVEKIKNLDTKVAQKTEQMFRSMGEEYNKRSKAEKIGIGLLLGLGAGVSSAVMLPEALILCVGGMAIQRAAGLASSFLKYEKTAQDWKWLNKKEVAMGKAIGSATLMTGGMLALVEGVKEATDWLAHYWPSDSIENHTIPTTAPKTEDFVHEPVTEHPDTPPGGQESATAEVEGKPIPLGSAEPEPVPEAPTAETPVVESPVTAAETPTSPPEQPLVTETIAQPPPHVEAAAEAPAPQVETPGESLPGSANKLFAAEETNFSGEEVSKVELPRIQESITNDFGLEIPTKVPHLYTDLGAAHTFVYGGSSTEQADTILKYLTENPTKVVYGADENANRIFWSLIKDKLVHSEPMQTDGFLGLFKSFIKAPQPNELETIIQ